MRCINLVGGQSKLLCFNNQHMYLIHVLLNKCGDWITTGKDALGLPKKKQKKPVKTVSQLTLTLSNMVLKTMISKNNDGQWII